ncbi:MAG: membrane protein insertase YidC, partial [Pseudomonadota bacterium]
MDDQNKNLILATALSFLVILVWFMLFPPEEALQDPNAPTTSGDTEQTQSPSATAVPDADDTGGADPTASRPSDVSDPGADALANAPRARIETPRLSGSVSLLGGRIDDLSLSDYRESLETSAETVRLLTPEGEPRAYYALFGWSPGSGLDVTDVPNAETLWSAPDGSSLAPGNDLVLSWDNGTGLAFQRTISVDENFLFSVTQT